MVEIAYEALGIPAPHYRLSLRGARAEIRRRRRVVAAERNGAPRRASKPRRRLRRSSRRGSVLRAQDRSPGLRPTGSRGDALDRAGRLPPSRPVRPRRVRRRHPSPTGHDPPEHRLDDGADGRTPARGPRRRAPGLVGSVSGADRSDRRRRRRALAPGSRSAPGLWRAGRGRRSRRDARRQDPRRAARQGPLHRRDRAAGSRERERRRPVTRRSSARSAISRRLRHARRDHCRPPERASSRVRISPSPIASTRARRRGDSCLSPCTCTSDPCSARLRRAGSTCPPSCGRAGPTCTLPCTW